MTWIAGAIVAVSAVAGVPEPTKLEGEYRLGGRLDHKGSPTEGGSHLYVSLSGAAARTLYESLAADPREDPCTGYTAKGRGNVACYEIEAEQEYFCSFSIDLERGAVEAGLGGCI